MRVKLHKSKPFGLQKSNITSQIIPFKKQVIFGEKFLSRLTNKQKLAVAAHELTHIKYYHECARLIVLIMIVTCVKFFLFPSTNISISAIIVIIIIFVILVPISWIIEFLADRGAAKQIDKNSIITVLQLLQLDSKKIKFYEFILGFILHPPFSFRIFFLEKL
jgi:Zn-dependent protease with chaperone function